MVGASQHWPSHLWGWAPLPWVRIKNNNKIHMDAAEIILSSTYSAHKPFVTKTRSRKIVPQLWRSFPSPPSACHPTYTSTHLQNTVKEKKMHRPSQLAAVTVWKSVIRTVLMFWNLSRQWWKKIPATFYSLVSASAASSKNERWFFIAIHVTRSPVYTSESALRHATL